MEPAAMCNAAGSSMNTRKLSFQESSNRFLFTVGPEVAQRKACRRAQEWLLVGTALVPT
jgi:hypothetical protein